MRTLTATDVARNFRRILDSLEHGGGEIVILRNRHPVAKLVPGAPRMTALEALGDLHGNLTDHEGEAWLKDIRHGDRRLAAERRDPWG
jgi:antitoxin (DNA-binding transcriptional repressor) of toxin-antitoxin stability system